jgi:hypothetical protein
MRLPRIQFTIRRLMVAVAIAALLLAWFHVCAVVAVAGMVLIVILPAVVAPPGRRLPVACWAASLQPLVPLVYLYATWVTAWCVLGHRPRPSLDDPKSISPVVEVPYCMFLVSVEMAAPFCLGTGLLLAVVGAVRRSAFGPLLAVPLAWLAAYLLLRWDPLGVLYWYMD